MKKQSVEVHTNSTSHLEAKCLENKTKMGIEVYMNHVVDETPIG